MLPNTYEEIKPELEDLLFFVDDTGHETFSGNQGITASVAALSVGSTTNISRPSGVIFEL